MSATIVFRGLMVFHMMNDVMEIGFLQDGRSGHVPRIITTKNGVISSIFDLRTVDDFGQVRDWEIEATNPIQDRATMFQHGENFNRRKHPHARDFRWIIDLEGSDLHNKDLSDDIDTSTISTVLRVPYGEFYTRLLSPPLTRQRVKPAGEDVYYGMTAEVTGCDIAFEVGKLRLKAGNSVVMDFKQGIEDGVIYEFSNAPPDVPPDDPYDEGGHFHMYYHELFKDEPAEQFDLVPEDDPSPAPDPATCGAAYLGKRGGGL